ncbi:MAG: M20 family metallopeptidase [Clostridium sp.]
MEEKIRVYKEEICALSQKRQKELGSICSYIFANPELGLHEVKAQKVLCDYLETNGFKVERGVGSLDTAFIATYDSGKRGPTVALMAEYDCLPQIGHGCGHNIIGTSSTGAAAVLKEVMEKNEIGGILKVMGTPAEENVGGKCVMLDEGAFKGIDAALIMHPTDASIPDDISFASVNMEYTFNGKPAHSAAFPWKGVNALTGVIQMFNAVDAMRLHFKDYTRVHGIITNGGIAHNTITDKAVAVFNIRALEYEYLMKVVEAINNCAKGSAICFGGTVDIKQNSVILKDVRNNKKLVNYVRKNMEFINEEYIERDYTQGIGSTDVGNVTHEIPAIQFYIKLKEGVGTHTLEFAEASGGEEGLRTLSAAMRVLALSGLDVLLDK